MKKTTLIEQIQKVDGENPSLENPQANIDFWNEARAGRYTRETKIIRSPKSAKQVKNIFGNMINNTIAQANDKGFDISDLLVYLIADRIPKGQGLTQGFLHEMMYVICPTTDDEGRRVTLSKMNTEQANNLFESFSNIMGGLGIVIPLPDENWAERK